MRREDRIREARRRAAESAPQRAAEAEDRATRLQQSVSAIGSNEAQRRVTSAQRSSSASYLGPLKTPGEWTLAVNIARGVAIAAAKQRRTLTYAELRLAVYEAIGKLVGWSMFAELAMSVNRKSDGVLLSSIIVHQDDGKPGDGFEPYARRQGFNDPVGTLQRQVFEHFSVRS